MSRHVLILALLLLCSLPLQAVEIRGVVQDAETGDALIGANVFIKGENIGSATNAQGLFTFEFTTDKPFSLVVSFMGYKKFEKVFKPDDNVQNLLIQMDLDVFRGEEVVVTGVASKTSKAVAEVAVSRLAADELTAQNSYQDMGQLVSGRVAGVKVELASGNVGSGVRFNMRAGGGLNGNEQPLIIVDGVRINNDELGLFDPDIGGPSVGGQGVSTLADLNPEDIENIEFLKGPAGAASYGTNGSNGVVLITTRRGSFVPGTGKNISFNYKYVTGMNTQAYEYDIDDYLSYKAINDIFRTGTIEQHSLNAVGGNAFIKYYVGLDHRFEEGISYNNDVSRTSFRANMDIFPNDKLVFNVSSNYVLSENQRPNNDNNIFGFMGNTILTEIPWTATDSAAVYAYQNITKANRFMGSFQGQWMPFKNFQAKFAVGIDDMDSRIDDTFPYGYDYAFYPNGMRGVWTRQNTQYTFAGDARYYFIPFAGLETTVIGGFQGFEKQQTQFFLEKQDFLTGLITNIGAGENLNNGDERKVHTREAGVFAEISNSYLQQYFFTLALRRDYASVIGSKAASIYYPRASFAVRVDRYPFMPKAISLLKLRTAYGETGVLPGIDSGIPLLWAAETSGAGVGAVLSNIGNEEIKPERVSEWELGFESEFLRHFALDLTYYQLRAKDSIIRFLNAPSTGQTASTVPVNIGEVESWGIESLLQANYRFGHQHSLDLSLVNNYQDNEVTDMGGASPIYDPWGDNVLYVGMPKHAFYLQEVYGATFDENGVYAGPDVAEEKTYQGTPIPTYTGSFSVNFKFFRNWNLYLMSDWATGHSVVNSTKLFAIYYANFFGGANVKRYRELEDQLGITDYYPDEQALEVGSDGYIEAAHEYAKLDTDYDSNFIEDADYLKLREISLSYNFRDVLKKQFKNWAVSDLSVGVSGRNLWLTSKYSGVDPEVNYNGARSLTRGNDFLTLQHPRVFNFWVKIGF